MTAVALETAKPAAHIGRRVLGRVRWLMVGLLVVGISIDLALLGQALAVAYSMDWGGDFIVLRNAALRWDAGGGFYLPWQFAPYSERIPGNILYPPAALALFLPFTVLPAFLWWLGPLAIVGATVWHWRPNRWAWAGIGICAVSWPMVIAVHQGNPVMWIAAFVALGTRWPAYAALVLLKPSLFPFALIGIRHRSWWLVTIILGAMSLALLPMVWDWLTVLGNLHDGRTGPLYSLTEVPIVAIPILAWLGRPRLLRDPVDADRARGDVAARQEEAKRVDRGGALV